MCLHGGTQSTHASALRTGPDLLLHLQEVGISSLTVEEAARLREQQAQGAAALPQGFPGGNPANEGMSRGTGLQVSHGGSVANRQRQTLLRDSCSPCWLGDKKTQL